MKKVRWIVLALVVVLAAALAVGCAGQKKSADADTTGTGKPIDTIKIGLGGDPASTDPAFAYDYTNNPPCNQISESLLKYDYEDQLQPYLCESWEEVDPLTYVYNVRSNVTFSDGTPMTMEDVLYSIERYRDPDIASYLMWMYDSVDTIEQTGDWQFTVKLQTADALWKHTFATTAGHILQKAYCEEVGDKLGKPGTGTIGTGAYVIESWDPGSQMTLTYNPSYWNAAEEGEPDVKTLIFQFIEEDSTRVMAAASKQIDINVSTPVDMKSDIDKAEGVELRKFPSAGLTFLAFNCRKAPFDDVNVRRAIASALDLASIQENIVKDYGEPTNWMALPATMFTFEKESWEAFEASDRIVKYEYNIEKAKEYLAQSSKPDGFKCTLMVDSTSTFQSMGLAIQQTLKEIGIEVELWKVTNVEAVDYEFGKDIDDKGIRPYDMGLYEWFSDFPDPSGDLVPIFKSTNAGAGGSNTSCLDNKDVDKLLDEQAQLSDDAKRTELMQDALNIITDQIPLVVMDHPNYLISVSDNVKEVNFDPFWIWNFYVKDFKMATK
ncbi:MAG: ABC transporter substrate-binding protein [Actinomycetes bacterium]|jgi:peptide/nickel transport system substrate-binding protein|nr:ABC transporter substrate-binding protein [Actinomycetes bacterium]